MEKDLFGHEYGTGEEDVKLASFIFGSTPESTDIFHSQLSILNFKRYSPQPSRGEGD